MAFRSLAERHGGRSLQADALPAQHSVVCYPSVSVPMPAGRSLHGDITLTMATGATSAVLTDPGALSSHAPRSRLGPRWRNRLLALVGLPWQRRLARATLFVERIRHWEEQFRDRKSVV